jgi:hypothetical protein
MFIDGLCGLHSKWEAQIDQNLAIAEARHSTVKTWHSQETTEANPNRYEYRAEKNRPRRGPQSRGQTKH